MTVPRYRALARFNPAQARRPDGEWGHGGAPSAASVLHYSGAARTKPSQWKPADVKAVDAAFLPDGKQDGGLLEMWRRQGFTGAAQVMPDAEFDALGDDYKRVFRGLSGPHGDEYAAQYASAAEPYPGLGLFGNGTYVAADRGRAERYMDDGQGNPDGALITMAIRPEAKVIALADMPNVLEGLPGGRLPPNLRKMVDTDPGRIATLLGYDVIDVTRDRRIRVILNRTAVVIRETP